MAGFCNRSRKLFWHRGAKKLGDTMVPGANFSNGTGAKHFQTWHRCQILNGTGATPLPNWHQCQFSKWHRCQAFSNFGTGAKF